MPTKSHAVRSHGSLTERAYRTLRTAVLGGDFKEGEFLTEKEARTRFQIGHTPFREACNRLLFEGLLESMPRRGYFVTPLSFQKVRNLFEVRTLVETQAVELAAERATPHQLEQMESFLKQRIAHTPSKNLMDELVRMNFQFHRALAEMTQNEEIVRVVEKVMDRAARIVYLSKLDSPHFDVHSQHRLIFKAVRARDGKLARKLLLIDLRAGQAELFK